MTLPDRLECGLCGRAHPADRPQGLSPCCARPLLARYDLDALRGRVTRAALERGDSTLWRFRDVLPLADARHEVTLGEGMTPLLEAPRLAADLGMRRLLVKDESGNPTGSFKARGLAVAVAKAVELGARAFAVPSAGNAAAALAAYAARAGAAAHVFLPRDVPAGIRRECESFGAEVRLVEGLITDAARAAAALVASSGGSVVDVSTLKEPYRVEGKKTMGYELALQLGWTLPDVVVYPTGGGTGIVGTWKAFAEMEALGLVGSERPRLVAVQSDGCAPIVRAFARGERHAEEWKDAATVAHGLRVPRAVGDHLILDALRASGGTAVAVPDADILAAQRDMARREGLDASPESAATLAGLRVLLERGDVGREETVVLFHTGSNLPYA